MKTTLTADLLRKIDAYWSCKPEPPKLPSLLKPSLQNLASPAFPFRCTPNPCFWRPRS
jgi:hypothetical protein